MTKTWPVTVATVVLSALAGVAIAGLPGEKDDFVIDASALTTTTPESSSGSTVQPVDTVLPVPETVAPTSPDPSGVTLERSAVRLVLANGAGTAGLVTSTAQSLRSLGYTEITGGDVADLFEQSIVYFTPGFADEAAVLAADLGVPTEQITELVEPITEIDASGDIIAILGADFTG